MRGANRIACLFAAALLWNGVAEAKTTITLLVGNVNESIWSDAVAAFERENPDIDVQPIYVAWDQTDDKFVTMVAGGAPPDVFLQNSVYGWARYVYEGLLMDLSPYVKRDRARIDYNDILPVGWKAATVGARLGGFAGLASGFGTMYNATLFEEAGLSLPPTDWADASWNWDTMVAAARKLTQVNADGKATRFGVDFWDADNLIGFAWGFGGDWFSPASYETGVVERVTLATPANGRAYEAVTALRTEHGVRPGGRVPAAQPIGGAQSFRNGMLGMWIDGMGLPNPEQTPSIKEFRWGFAPFPYAEGTPRNRTFSWSGAYAGIAAGSKNPDEAWRLITYLSGRATDPAVRAALYMNPRRSNWLASVEEWLKYGLIALDAGAFRQAVFGGLERAAPLPRSSMVGATEVWNVFNKQVVPALRGQGNVRAALEQAQPVAEATVASLKEQLKID